MWVTTPLTKQIFGSALNRKSFLYFGISIARMYSDSPDLRSHTDKIKSKLQPDTN